jgi:hypothetical protein
MDSVAIPCEIFRFNGRPSYSRVMCLYSRRVSVPSFRIFIFEFLWRLLKIKKHPEFDPVENVDVVPVHQNGESMDTTQEIFFGINRSLLSALDHEDDQA